MGEQNVESLQLPHPCGVSIKIYFSAFAIPCASNISKSLVEFS